VLARGCVVSQVPTISGWESTLRRIPPQALAGQRRAFDSDRLERYDVLATLDLPDDAAAAAVVLAVDAAGTATARTTVLLTEADRRSLEALDRISPARLMSRRRGHIPAARSRDCPRERQGSLAPQACVQGALGGQVRLGRLPTAGQPRAARPF